MSKAKFCALVLSLMAGLAVSQPTVTWTGAAGDNSWNNPGNWDSGTVPTEADNVNIPAGTPQCNVDVSAHANNLTNNGTIGSNLGGTDVAFIHTQGDITSNGTIQTGGDNAHLFAGGTVVNSGSISGDHVEIHASSVVNQSAGLITTAGGGNGINISAYNSVVNNGTIRPGACTEGGSGQNGVGIQTLYPSGSVTNNGTIHGGNGQGDGVSGGGVAILSDQVNNSGTIKPGNGGPEGHDGKTEISAKKVNNTGTIGGSSGPTLQHELGDLTLVADTIFVSPGDSIVEGNNLRLVGRAITVSNLQQYVFHETSLDFYTTPEGWIDFSGTHCAHCIFGPSASRIYSDSVFPPRKVSTISFCFPLKYSRPIRPWSVATSPINERTSIQYALPNSSHSRIVIYDLLGQRVKTLVNEKQSAGTHTTVWDSRNAFGEPATSGLYFVSFEASGHRTTQRLLLLR